MENQKIWDPVIRFFHWSVSFAFLLNYFVLEEGGNSHELAGYYILCALAVRFIWGVIGARNARFVSFYPTIKGVKEHIKAVRSGKIPEENGHNPVGALMVFALLFCLLATGVTGWSTELELGHWVKETHEFFANTTMYLVVIHVMAVVFFSYKGPRNLIKQMVSGRVEKN